MKTEQNTKLNTIQVDIVWIALAFHFHLDHFLGIRLKESVILPFVNQ